MKLFIYLCLWVTCFAPYLAQRINKRQATNCITHDYYRGYCVLLTYCPDVVNLFQTQNRRWAEQIAFALQRSCGTRNVNGDPVVCCTRPSYPQQTRAPPTRAPPTRAPPTRAPVTTAPNPFFPPNQTTRGPFIQPTIESISRNPPTGNPFLPEPPQRITSRPTTPTTTTSTTTTTTPPPVTSAPMIDNRAPTCNGPDFREGVCISIQQCNELLTELAEKQTDPDFGNFLRASNKICGGRGSLVCCPMNARIEQTTTGPAITPPNDDVIPRRLPTVEEGCGFTRQFQKNKVVGGVDAKLGAYPWIALLGYDDGLSSSPFKCGGTLVTARHVVSAAHCMRKDIKFVRLGEHDLRTDNEAQHLDINILRFVTHPNYDRRDGHSDIAIIFLERNVKFTAFITPICLPTARPADGYIGRSPFLAGWGKVMEGGKSAEVLQELQVPVLPNNVCMGLYRKANRVASTKQFDAAVLCAGDVAGGKDSCQGDSGGPLMAPESLNGGTRFFLIGVVSYGVGCARKDLPGVYTSITHFKDWIEQNIAETL